jgi:hypothetical protein
MPTRPDQSDYLVHFTKGDTAYETLVKILTDKTLKAATIPWVNRAAVCLTECPWPSLIGHSRQYSPYGIGFTKPHVFAAGGGPAYYVRADLFKKQAWDNHVKTFVTPFWPEYRPDTLKSAEYMGGKTIDYSHEREWRVPHNFTFELEQVAFVVVASYEDLAKFPRDLKNVIGRDKFILVDIYTNIEALWPTHNI